LILLTKNNIIGRINEKIANINCLCHVCGIDIVVHSNSDYVNNESILRFIITSSTLIGILLAGVLTSLAIILAIISTNEMIRMNELESSQNKNFYKNISNNLRQNIHFILVSFVFSSLASIFSIEKSFFIIPLYDGICFEIYRSLFVIVATLFITSCIATYDIINGLFEIFQFKYDLSNQNDNK